VTLNITFASGFAGNRIFNMARSAPPKTPAGNLGASATGWTVLTPILFLSFSVFAEQCRRGLGMGCSEKGASIASKWRLGNRCGADGDIYKYRYRGPLSIGLPARNGNRGS
jgi:hypothetical protein